MLHIEMIAVGLHASKANKVSVVDSLLLVVQ